VIVVEAGGDMSHAILGELMCFLWQVREIAGVDRAFDTTMKYYTSVPADLQEQAAEALGELLFGASNGPTRDPTPVTFLSDPDKLAALKAELQEKLLQIEGLEGRARQDSNLRPSDS
jgi:hypothetical protein